MFSKARESHRVGTRPSVSSPRPSRITTSLVLGASHSLGRLFEAEAEQLAAACVVLSHDFFASRFGGDANVIGATIRLNGQPFTVIGVSSERFQGTGIARPDLWVPIPDDPRAEGSVVVGARLKAGVSASQAAGELDVIGRTLDLEHGRRNGVRRFHLCRPRGWRRSQPRCRFATGLMATGRSCWPRLLEHRRHIAGASGRPRGMSVRIAICACGAC